mmetsp:Transcript_1018/g.3494  ORF Transcript_1018/g.3494 Transcript_1018/m.3494 type:complete len:496 (-) Transcript_1018:1512-2999(-)
MPKKSKKSDKLPKEQPYFELDPNPQVFDPELQDDASVESVESYGSDMGAKPSIDDDLFNLLSNLREGNGDTAASKPKRKKAPKRRRGDEAEDEDLTRGDSSSEDESTEHPHQNRDVQKEGKKAMFLDRYKNPNDMTAEDVFLRNFLVKAGKLTDDKEFAFQGAEETRFHFDTSKLDLVHPTAYASSERDAGNDDGIPSRRTIKKAKRKKRQDDLVTMLTLEERRKQELRTKNTEETQDDDDVVEGELDIAERDDNKEDDNDEPTKEDEFDEKEDLSNDLKNIEIDDETKRQIEVREREISEQVIALIHELQAKFIKDDESALSKLDVKTYEDFDEQVDTNAVADEIFAPSFDPSTRTEEELDIRRKIYNLMNDYYSVYSEFATNAFRYPYKQIQKVNFGVSIAELIEMDERELNDKAPVDTFGRPVKRERRNDRGDRGGRRGGRGRGRGGFGGRGDGRSNSGAGRGVKRPYGYGHERKKKERFEKFKKMKKQKTE